MIFFVCLIKQTKIMKQNYILIALFMLLGVNNGNAQGNYAVNSIPYVPYQGSMTNLNTSDDMCSGLITLPFSFDYYGATYNQVVISTNGYVDLRSSSANMYSPFSFSTTIPNTAFPVKNSILGAYQDLYNTTGGFIGYTVYGTAPYRKFIVYYYQNALFACSSMRSTFQIVLHETSNIIDVILIDKQACANANAGRTVTGLIDISGANGISPAGRNTGFWSAYHEAWRFSRPGYYANYSYVLCDPNNDGIGDFNVAVIQNDLFPSNPSSVNLYPTMADAGAQTNAITGPFYTSLSQNQVIYAVYNGQIKAVTLQAIDCTIDADNDSVPTDLEDLNADTNLANDDTDADGIPNYSDNDDDGDMILTNLEYVFPKTNSATSSVNVALDTDNDGTPNYLDNDDDGDGVLTYLEDYNGNGNPADDDTNANGTPDYMESAVALGVNQNENADFAIYPNPVNDQLFIQNPNQLDIQSILIYNTNGVLVKQVNTAIESVPVNDLAVGLYLVQVKTTTGTSTMKFIKR